MAALGLLLAAGAAALLYLTRDTTFFQDEWSWILARRAGAGPLLHPYNMHLSLIPVAIYQLLFATAGLGHYWVFRAVGVAGQLTVVALVFLYARHRVGPWLALVAATLIMFFGPGWQDILWPFQIAWLITVAAGIGALLALDRHTRRGDLSAALLTAVALASASPGIAVAVGVLVEVVVTRRRWWIVAVPIALYAVWWLLFEQSGLIADSILRTPLFVWDSAAGVASTLTGVATVNVNADTGSYLTLGPALLILGLAAAGWRLRRLGRLPTRVLTLAVIPLSFWTVAGLGRATTRIDGVILHFSGDQGRYLYIGAAWTLLLVVELAAGVRPSRITLAVATVLGVAIVIANAGILRDGAGVLRAQAQITRAELGTLDLTRARVAPSFASSGFVFFAYVTAGAYFDAERDLGSYGPTPAQLAALSPGARTVADAQLIRIDRPTLAPVATAPVRCLTRGATPAPSAAGGVVLPAAGLTIATAPGAGADLYLRRFSATPLLIGHLAPGARGRLVLPGDTSPLPWRLGIASTGPVRLCSA